MRGWAVWLLLVAGTLGACGGGYGGGVEEESDCTSYEEKLFEAATLRELKESIREAHGVDAIEVTREQGQLYVYALNERGGVRDDLEVRDPEGSGDWSAYTWHQCID